jgi:hypothetical protein
MLREVKSIRRRAPSLANLIDEYLTNLSYKAASSVYTEGVHPRRDLNAGGGTYEAPTRNHNEKRTRGNRRKSLLLQCRRQDLNLHENKFPLAPQASTSSFG